MMTRLASVAAILVLAGCLQPSQSETASAEFIDEERPNPTFGHVTAGPAAGPDLDATTAAPPTLVGGEWWRIRFESPFFGETPEFLRVVAQASEEGYVIGMPHEGWYKEALVYHSPGFGDVAMDLSYSLHNLRFEPLRFPLTSGAAWTTNFGPGLYEATVETATQTKATIVLEPLDSEPEPTDPIFSALSPIGDGTIRLLYDATQHEIVRFESPIGNWEVLEHGYDYVGWVTVPRGLHTVIDYGQFLTATPSEPLLTRTKLVEGGFNRLTLLQGIFALGPGSYSVVAAAPDDKTYAVETTTASSGFWLKVHEAINPDGQWKLEDRVFGPGGTYTMGMAYHQYDVRLPDGTQRTDHAHPVVR